MVHQHDGQHGLGNRRGAHAHAGIVTTLGHHLDGIAVDVDGIAGQGHARGRLQRDADHDVLPRGNAAQHATRVVAGEAVRIDLVAVLLAALAGHGKAVADFHRLYRIDAHHRVRDVGIEAVEHRLAPAHRHLVGMHREPCPAAGAVAAQLGDQFFHLRHGIGIAAEEGILVDQVPVQRLRLHRTDLRDMAPDLDAELRLQVFLGDGTGRNTHRRLTRRGAAAAAIVAEAVFLRVGVVGMAGTERRGDVGVVLGFLVGVLDQKADGRARGPALEHAGEDFHHVVLATLRAELRGAGLAPVEVGLQVGLGQLESGWHAVDNGAEREAMRFAEGGDAEKFAYGVAGHVVSRFSLSAARQPPCILGHTGQGRRRQRVVPPLILRPRRARPRTGAGIRGTAPRSARTRPARRSRTRTRQTALPGNSAAAPTANCPLPPPARRPR